MIWLIISPARISDNPVGFNFTHMKRYAFHQYRQQPELPLLHPIEGVLAETGRQSDGLTTRGSQQQRRFTPTFIRRAPPARPHGHHVGRRRDHPPEGPLAPGITTYSHLAAGRIPGCHYGVSGPLRCRKGCNKTNFSVVFPQIHVNHMLHSITFYQGENGGNPKYHAVNSVLDLYQTRVKKLLSDGKECCYAPVN